MYLVSSNFKIVVESGGVDTHQTFVGVVINGGYSG